MVTAVAWRDTGCLSIKVPRTCTYTFVNLWYQHLSVMIMENILRKPASEEVTIFKNRKFPTRIDLTWIFSNPFSERRPEFNVVKFV